MLLAANLVLGCRGPRPANGRPELHDPRAKEVAARLGPGEAVSAQQASSPACLRVVPGKPVGKLSEEELDEVSGLVASRAQSDLLWVHNDSGDGPRVFALDLSGRVRLEVTLRGADAVDFEDLAIGPRSRRRQDVPLRGRHRGQFERRDRVHISTGLKNPTCKDCRQAS